MIFDMKRIVDGKVEIVGTHPIRMLDDSKAIAKWLEKDTDECEPIAQINENNSTVGDCHFGHTYSTLAQLSSPCPGVSAGDGFVHTYSTLGHIKYQGPHLNSNNGFVHTYSTQPTIDKDHPYYKLGMKVGKLITHQNFFKYMSYYACRRIIEYRYYNAYDEFQIPNTKHPKFKQFLSDSVVVGIFNNGRTISLDGIDNNFFYMSKAEMLELAIKYNYGEMIDTCNQSTDRFLYNVLNHIELSPDAVEVLEMARDLTRISMERREEYCNTDNGKIGAYWTKGVTHEIYKKLKWWDCSYIQLKPMWRQWYPKQYREFMLKYKGLKGRMRPLVYELGFLRDENYVEEAVEESDVLTF